MKVTTYLTLFQEKGVNKQGEEFTVVRGDIPLPKELWQDSNGFKAVARVYAQGFSDCAKQLAALKVKDGVGSNGTKYVSFGTCELEVEPVGRKDFQCTDGTPGREYRFNVLAIKRASDEGAKTIEALFA